MRRSSRAIAYTKSTEGRGRSEGVHLVAVCGACVCTERKQMASA